MKIIHITSINTTISNGIRFSVPGLVAAQNQIEGIEAVLLNVTPTLAKSSEFVDANFTYIEYDKSKIEELNLNRYDLAVFHSYYHVEFLKLYKTLKEKGIPYIITPRGTFTRLARKRKPLKKFIGDFLFFDQMLKGAGAIHFLTKEELENSRYFNKKCFVVPNGIHSVKNRIPRKETKNLVFLGRLDSYTKGLDLLVEAVKLIADTLRTKQIAINLYGSDFPVGTKKVLVDYIKSTGLEDLISVNDAVYGEEKNNILDHADVFISPSRFEGLPMSILEALAHGLPCIITPETNLSNEVTLYDAGWITTLRAEDIANKIIDSIEERKLESKSENAYKLVEEMFDWQSVAKRTLEEYRKLGKNE